MQAAISPMFCIALIMFFFINNTSKIECELFFLYRRERCIAQPSVKVL